MQAIKLGWLFDEEGQKYLQALLDSDNMEHFSIKTNIVMIEFLYFHFKKRILETKFPIYIAQLFVYFGSAVFF